MTDIEKQVRHIKALIILYLILFVGYVFWVNHKLRPVTEFMSAYEIMTEYEEDH